MRCCDRCKNLFDARQLEKPNYESAEQFELLLVRPEDKATGSFTFGRYADLCLDCQRLLHQLLDAAWASFIAGKTTIVETHEFPVDTGTGSNWPQEVKAIAQ
jgi:hypothetical protein